MKSPRFATRSSLLATALLALLTAAPGPSLPAADAESAADKQRKLIAILQSDAPPQDKAIPCKQLAIYGNKDAVPALAPLLADKDLASWARIALEVIPGPEADAALRDAVPKLSGRLLIGTINSIGVRRDAAAVPVLTPRLQDPKIDIVNAAAVALGRISGPAAAAALQAALNTPDLPVLAAVAEGAILCAEGFLTAGQPAKATPLYDAVRQADVPKQRWLEATRGAILARQTDGLPLLLAYLRSPVRAEFAMALRTARELPGRAITEALGDEFDRSDKAGSERGVMILLALADRSDDAVYPKLLQVAAKGSKAARVAALGLLDRSSDVASLPVLLAAAAEPDAEIAAPAKATLTRMEGQAIDQALTQQLAGASGRAKQAIIELAALRRIEAAVPAIVPSVTDANPDIRRAAVATLGALGSEPQLHDLVQLLAKTPEGDDRESVEGALIAISGRAGAKSIPVILPLLKQEDSDRRKAALRILAAVGGREALGAIGAAVQDADESVQDEAVGLLATWPNNWPDDSAVTGPLLSLVKSGKKRAHQVQGARGYLLSVRENKNLSTADRLQAIDQLLPLLTQPPEKRLAIAALGSIASVRSLDTLAAFTREPGLADEACLAIVGVATAKPLEGATPDRRRQALQAVLAATQTEAIRKKATDGLNGIK